MKKTKSTEHLVEIVLPSQEMFEVFKSLKRDLIKVFPEQPIILIGSLAVPMKGKKEVDVMVEVDDVFGARQQLIKWHFSPKSNWINPNAMVTCFQEFRNGIECDIHLVIRNSRIAQLHKSLIQILKNDSVLKSKFELLKENCQGMEKHAYRKRKKQFYQEHSLVDAYSTT